MPVNDPFLGTGWSFPPAFDKVLASVETTSGVEDIHKSLEIIFNTALGERVMQPTFGCSLEEQLFEPMNTGRLTYIENLIKTAILYHEPRIDADEIEVRFDALEGALWIRIGYKVRTSNSRFNFVYPFYL
ncbi:MAG TPA: GPW/gp25 family protein [Rhodothermales bacterium]|nr:GPW/gp25 family protein [Rhodothermales bacterium]